MRLVLLSFHTVAPTQIIPLMLPALRVVILDVFPLTHWHANHDALFCLTTELSLADEGLVASGLKQTLEELQTSLQH